MVKAIQDNSKFIFTFLFIGIALRIVGLDRSLGDSNENLILLFYANSPLEYIVSNYPWSGHHIFNTIFLHLMVALFGEENAFFIRLPGFIFATASLWLIYQVTLKIFNESLHARYALILAVFSPLHIYYSQTARGYSLVFFFTTLMVYAALRLLESKNFARWGLILTFSGFLAIYTIPTSVHFVFGLFAWVFFILISPRLTKEFNWNKKFRIEKAWIFFFIFLMTLFLTYLAHFPLIDQMIASAKNYYLPKVIYTSKTDIILRFLPKTLSFLFPGPLIFFLPIFLLGIFSRNVVSRSYCLLPIFILAFTYFAVVITGLAWKPRGYLFLLPICVIFLSGGVIDASRLASKLLRNYNENTIVTIIAIFYVAATLTNSIPQYSLWFNSPSGSLFKKKLQESANPNDLLVLAHSNNFLYARRTYHENLKNILLQNKLTGIKMVAANSFAIDDYNIPQTQWGRGFRVFRFLFFKKNLSNLDVKGGQRLFNLTSGESISVLPDDFESQAKWKIVSGSGTFSKESEHKLTGESSFQLKPDLEKDLVIEAPLTQEVNIGKYSIVALVWAGHSKPEPNSLLSPEIILIKISSSPNRPLAVYNKIQPLQNYEGAEYLRLGIINLAMRGMDLNLIENTAEKFNWKVQAYVGKIPPGKYSMSFRLKAKNGKSVLYDSLRLFIISKSGNPDSTFPP